ncbi:MAG TPA: serine hydrolase domain-containing protein [Mycobacteriales bacterium]|nr:serine hydrolase domain-containing protein [Mycobacteriales bacterium]
MDGYVHPGFVEVARVFERQLRRTDGGAAVAVYHRGELVVDLWGGQRAGGDTWREDTLSMCFSSTKGIASTALHLLADRGRVDYAAPVGEYWPEFARAGKESCTVQHVLTHAAGLHKVRSLIEHSERMLDWDFMVDALANAWPAYEPGTRNGYHALTYGWLVGEIIRRVDGRDITTFVADEIAAPLKLDGLYIGCPPAERDRVAPLAPMAKPLLRLANPRKGGLAERFTNLPATNRVLEALSPQGIEDVLWRVEAMDAAIPAANGFVTARSLAKMYAMIAGGGTVDGLQLLSPETVRKAGTVHGRGRDVVLGMSMGWRLGYHKAFTTRGASPTAFGHFGFGGSGGWCDPARALALAMVCSRGTGTPVGDARIAYLGTAASVSAARR